MPITVKTFDQLSDAASALGSDRAARFLAGGTLVMRDVNEGDVSIETIVRATDPGFREIRPAGGTIMTGAGVTMSQVLGSSELALLHPVARAVGGPAIRSMATVGGNLFAPSPYGDFATALLALGATVSVVSGYSPRDMDLAEFLSNRERHQGSLVSSISFQRPSDQRTFRFAKVSRVKPKGASVMCIAALLPQSGGRISGARIAYGAMAPTPIRVPAVERALEGKTLDASGVSAAIDAATEGTSPATDPIASEWYRRAIAPVHLSRLLLGETA